MEFSETASPDILGSGGPHRVARNFGNNLNPKFRQQFQNKKIFVRFRHPAEISNEPMPIFETHFCPKFLSGRS